MRPVLDGDALAAWPEIERLAEALARHRAASGGNLWGSSQALALAALFARAPRFHMAVLALTSTETEAQVFADDLAAFGADATWFPARESYSSERRAARADADMVRLRLQVAQRIAGPPAGRPRMIVASLLSMLQRVPSPGELAKDFLALRVGQRLDSESILERLVGSGYVRQPLAEQPGEVSLRGEILDVYPFAAERPLRIELFGEEIESLRSFDPLDQRSVESFEAIEVCLATDAGGVEDGSGVLPAALLDPATVFARIEPLRIEDRAEGLRIQSPNHARALARQAEIGAAHPRLDLQSLPAAIDFGARSVQALSVGMREAPRALAEVLAGGARAIVLCQNEAEEHRFRGLLESVDAAKGVETRIGSIAKGFRLPALKLVLVNHRELAGVVGRRVAQKPLPAHRVRAIQSFFELAPGDLVVHAVHGLARFKGLRRLEHSQAGGGEEDHLHLVFEDDVSLYVPASRIDLVQRFVGSGSAAPGLDKIGSQSFRKRKEKVERALFDLAAELLEIQARRAVKTRPPWHGDPELSRDMIGAFPYEDTPDQVQTDREITEDLRAEKPMDRLLCGDVGFGKTELAVRAAFHVVCGGGQVAVLVPTTVLAQQHYDTFRGRLADFPVEVAELSRYIGGREEAEVLEKLERGEVDVVIGTHRILSSDVRFKNLGLVVVDEEQRFGVTHKEHFKKLRAEVDVLTLTATPIPRTLHMSLAGVRDISALTVPPEGRQEIETVLGYTDEEDLLREAILREKNRGGQVFFLHNRVGSIAQVALKLSRLVPECSFAIGHGQMGARELKRVMDSFTRGDTDVLVATTIIESGIDIPSAGTIVVDRADLFGLSELHQLRGRVGRGPHKAFCYLLVDRHVPLPEAARERLKALEELNQLGAGFAISMKDLEIRGAGNVLGPQQSGHIGAVGYDMYCRLLKQAIDRLQAGEPVDAAATPATEEAGAELELGLRAFLPEEWIPETRIRLEVLRELATIRTDEDAQRAIEMLRDRFGRVPSEALELVRMFRLKARLERVSITRLSWRGDLYLVEFEDRVALERGLDFSAARPRAVKTGVLHLPIPARSRTPGEALSWFESLLKGEGAVPRMAAR